MQRLSRNSPLYLKHLHGHHQRTLCPHCRQNAPLVYRGIAAYCTACNRPRLPLTERSINLAGQPSQIGGTLARVMGWLVLIGGLFLSLALLGILIAIFPESVAGFIVGGGAALATGLLSWLFLRGGKNLKADGKDAEKNARVSAIYAMAPIRHGLLRASDVAVALQITADAADALLTDLAKTQSDHVSLEIDEQGGLYYRVDPSGRVQMRVETIPSARVRVDEQPKGSKGSVPQGEVIDAELSDPHDRARRHAQR